MYESFLFSKSLQICLWCWDTHNLECVNVNYLLLADRFYGYPWMKPLQTLSTESVVKTLMMWFLQFGFPRSIQTDGSPQFQVPFKQFCNNYGIQHEVSLTYNSISSMTHWIGKPFAYCILQQPLMIKGLETS